jgi:hypothetical protein
MIQLFQNALLDSSISLDFQGDAKGFISFPCMAHRKNLLCICIAYVLKIGYMALERRKREMKQDFFLNFEINHSFLNAF